MPLAWPWTVIVAVLALSGCATSTEEFEGPLDPVTLSPAQIKLVQQGIAKSLKDPASASLVAGYRAGTSMNRQIAVCGYVNGKQFVGLFFYEADGSPVFLPVMIGGSEAEDYIVNRNCRADGIYLEYHGYKVPASTKKK
jgi:hypothetical protein